MNARGTKCLFQNPPLFPTNRIPGVVNFRRPHTTAVRVTALESDAVRFKAAAGLVADTYLVDGCLVGLGTGEAVNEFIRELSERLTEGRIKNVRCVPGSDVSASEAAFYGVPLATLDDVGGAIDVLIDQADEVDIAAKSHKIAYIVGRGSNGPQAGQPSLPRLRALLASARRAIVLADGINTHLDGELPVIIEGDETTWEETAEELDDLFLGDAEVRRRSFLPDAGPRGGDAPVVTPEGHYVLDIQFYEGLKLYGEDAEYKEIAAEIEKVPGVVTHGLIVGAEKAVGSPVVVVVAPEGPPRLVGLNA